MADAVTWASWAAHQVAIGRIGAREGDVIARLVREFRQSLEREAMAGELQRLRAEVARMKAAGR